MCNTPSFVFGGCVFMYIFFNFIISKMIAIILRCGIIIFTSPNIPGGGIGREMFGLGKVRK